MPCGYMWHHTRSYKEKCFQGWDFSQGTNSRRGPAFSPNVLKFNAQNFPLMAAGFHQRAEQPAPTCLSCSFSVHIHSLVHIPNKPEHFPRNGHLVLTLIWSTTRCYFQATKSQTEFIIGSENCSLSSLQDQTLE